MATFQYKYDAKAFNEMYMTKIKLIDGKIDKESMEVFLRSLAFVIPPNIQLITEQTNEENDADVQSFEQKLNSKSSELKDDPNISADTYRSKREEKHKKQKVNAVAIESSVKEEVKEDENPNNVSNLTELQKEFEN